MVPIVSVIRGAIIFIYNIKFYFIYKCRLFQKAEYILYVLHNRTVHMKIIYIHIILINFNKLNYYQLNNYQCLIYFKILINIIINLKYNYKVHLF